MSDVQAGEDAYVEAGGGAGIGSLKNALHIVLRRKWLVLSVFVVSMTAAVLYADYSITPMYEATAQILVSPGREHVSDITIPTGGAVQPMLRFDAEEQVARAREILTGRFLAERVVQKVGADSLFGRHVNPASAAAQARREEAAVNLFLKRVAADSAGRSSLVNIAFRHEDPQVAAQSVNTLADTYVERYVGMQKDPRTDAFFREQFDALKAKLAQAEANLLAFKQRHGIAASLDEEQDAIRQQQGVLRAELNDSRARQAELQSRAAEIHRQIAEHGSLYGNLQSDLLHNGADEKAVRARQATLAGRVGELQGRLDGLERLRDEFNRLEKQVKADEDNYKLYVNKFEESRIAGAMDAERLVGVRVIERAQPPALPLPANRNRILLLGAALGLFGGLALAFVLHFLGRTVDTPEDVERLLDLPVLASTPHLRRSAPFNENGAMRAVQ